MKERFDSKEISDYLYNSFSAIYDQMCSGGDTPNSSNDVFRVIRYLSANLNKTEPTFVAKHESGAYYATRDLKDLAQTLLDCAEAKEKVTVETVEMTNLEFFSLPEFEGF